MEGSNISAEGWGDDITKKKSLSHYFKDGKSLCERHDYHPVRVGLLKNAKEARSKYVCACQTCNKKLVKLYKLKAIT